MASLLLGHAHECDIFLESDVYYPGQTITGRVQCNFLAETAVKGIHVKLKGRAKVYWREGRYAGSYGNEIYCEMDTDVLSAAVIPRGPQFYPFSFTLPLSIPPSLSNDNGSIKYSLHARIDRPWAMACTANRRFLVLSHFDLNTMPNLHNPFEVTKTAHLLSFPSEGGSITITVKVPMTGFVRSQMVPFSVQLKNSSEVTVQGVYFKLVQRYEFHAKSKTRSIDGSKGQQLAVVDSLVEPGGEKSWDLELKVPSDMYNGNHNFCNVIKSYVDLRGKVKLPIPHKNFRVTIPLTLGNVRLRK